MAARDALLLHALRVKCKDGLHEQARERAEERGIEAKARAPRKRKRQHPLAKGRGRKHAFGQIQRTRRHLATEARRAEATPPAAERHKALLAAIRALYMREAAAEEAAIEKAFKLFAHEVGQSDRQRALLNGLVQRREILLHNPVKRRLFRATPRVESRWRDGDHHRR